MSVGELAGHFQLATHVLRHWEAMGLLHPARDGGGRRRYDDAHVVRVAAILRAKEAGLTLEEIREVLQAEAPGVRRAHLERHRDVLRRRITHVQACLDMVECALDCDHEDLATCPQFLSIVG
ncbi:MerR family transcriptional regulator [Streptomyces sp. ISL-100]|nr:MerR family transcriptional regulator [Streptomyces sp. ISL-100]